MGASLPNTALGGGADAAEIIADAAESFDHGGCGVAEWCGDFRREVGYRGLDAVESLAEAVGDVAAELFDDRACGFEWGGYLADAICDCSGGSADFAEPSRAVEHGHVGVGPAGAEFVDRVDGRTGDGSCEGAERGGQ
jgi:hypothetical protein